MHFDIDSEDGRGRLHLSLDRHKKGGSGEEPPFSRGPSIARGKSNNLLDADFDALAVYG